MPVSSERISAPEMALKDYSNAFFELEAAIEHILRRERGIKARIDDPEVGDDVLLDALAKARSTYHIKVLTPKEYLETKLAGSGSQLYQGFSKEIEREPGSIARLDLLVAELNSTTDISAFKRAFHEAFLLTNPTLGMSVPFSKYISETRAH